MSATGHATAQSRGADATSSPDVAGAVWRWFPTVVAALLPLLVIRQVVTPVHDPDSFWHVVAGRHLWESGDFAATAPWPPRATQPWVLHEWLPELAFAAADHAAGLRGVVVVQAVLGLTLLLMVYLVSRRWGPPLQATLVTLVAWVGVSGAVSARPQVVSVALLAVATSAWLATARDHRPRWWLVPLSWVWASSHGLWFSGVLVGAAVATGLVLDGAPRRVVGRLSILVAGTALGGLATPAGPHLLATTAEIGRSTQYVAEWVPLSLRAPAMAATAVLAVIVVAGWARTGRRVPWPEVAVWCLALAWALAYGRTVALAAVMLAPLATRVLSRLSRAVLAPRPAHERLALASGFATALALALLLSAGHGVPSRAFPTGLDPVLDKLPPQSTVLNEYSLGGWLLYAHPDLAAVIDGRSELYPADDVSAYMAALSATPGWDRYVRSTGASHALLPEGNALASALQAQAGWTVLARSGGYLVLVAPAH